MTSQGQKDYDRFAWELTELLAKHNDRVSSRAITLALLRTVGFGINRVFDVVENVETQTLDATADEVSN